MKSFILAVKTKCVHPSLHDLAVLPERHLVLVKEVCFSEGASVEVIEDDEWFIWLTVTMRN